MRVVFTIATTIAFTTLTAAAQQGPMPANRLTPLMLQEIAIQYPEKAVECFRAALKEIEESPHEFIFTNDYQLGQLWLFSMEVPADSTFPFPFYICTPDGLANSPEALAKAMTGGMGLPF